MTVAAVNAHAVAGGTLLALACDFRIASDKNCYLSVKAGHIGLSLPSVMDEVALCSLPTITYRDAILTGKLYS